MFAYCGNCPVSAIDSSGQFQDYLNEEYLFSCPVTAGGTGTLGVVPDYTITYQLYQTSNYSTSSYCYSTPSSYYSTYASTCYSDWSTSNSYCLSAGTPVPWIINTYATTGTPYAIGRAGEDLAGIVQQQQKTPIEIHERTRIPDKLDDKTLTEVKNVKYISNTLQLQDYADFAHRTGRKLVLFVRPSTKIAKTIINSDWNIQLLW